MPRHSCRLRRGPDSGTLDRALDGAQLRDRHRAADLAGAGAAAVADDSGRRLPAARKAGADRTKSRAVIRSDPVERDVVVENDDAALKPPLAFGFDQIAFVTARRQQLALGVACQDVQQITGRLRPIAIDRDSKVRDHMAKLRAALVKPRKTLGKSADRGVP